MCRSVYTDQCPCQCNEMNANFNGNRVWTKIKQVVVKDLDLFVINNCLCLVINDQVAKACCIHNGDLDLPKHGIVNEAFKYQTILVIFSQDVEVEESPAPVCCTIVTMFSCENWHNKYCKKTNILPRSGSRSTRKWLKIMQSTWAEGTSLIPSHWCRDQDSDSVPDTIGYHRYFFIWYWHWYWHGLWNWIGMFSVDTPLDDIDLYLCHSRQASDTDTDSETELVCSV